jgi:hypothetical protein
VFRGSPRQSKRSQGSSHELSVPFRELPNASRHVCPDPKSSASAAPSMRFCPLQRIPEQGSGMVGRVYLTRPPAPSGFLNLLALRSALNLLALFHARSVHGVHPSERCSSRAVVRRFRRRSPHDVRAARAPHHRRSTKSQHRSVRQRRPTAKCEAHKAFPAYRVLLRARVRHETTMV